MTVLNSKPGFGNLTCFPSSVALTVSAHGLRAQESDFWELISD